MPIQIRLAFLIEFSECLDHVNGLPQVVLGPPPAPEVNAASQNQEPPSKARISWARLLKRVFNLDVEVCVACGGKTKIITAIEDPPVIRKILEHLGLPSKPPPILPARGPPSRHQGDDEYSQQPSFDFE